MPVFGPSRLLAINKRLDHMRAPQKTDRHPGDVQTLAASLSPVRESRACVRRRAEDHPPGTVGRYNPFLVDIVRNVSGNPLRIEVQDVR